MLPTNQYRLEYYLSDFIHYTNHEFVIDSKDINNKDINAFVFHTEQNPTAHFRSELQNYIDKNYLVYNSDGFTLTNINYPILSKARGINTNGILVKLQRSRHFNPILTARTYDIPWHCKKSTPIWRGSHTTGVNKLSNRRKTIKLLSDKFDIKCYNSNYNKIKEALKNGVKTGDYVIDSDPEFFKYLTPVNTSYKEQLENKYIISIEGNDVASNLKWALGSNSIVIMPNPGVESWAMEGLLEPYVHYIPVDHTFSNFEQQLEWCKEHDKECQEINKNAKEWVNMFLDEKNEETLQKSICDFYRENFKITIV